MHKFILAFGLLLAGLPAFSTANAAVYTPANDLKTAVAGGRQTTIVRSKPRSFTDGSGAVVATVRGTGAHPVSGTVTSQLWIEPSVPAVGASPFVARHYQITPARNAGTATGTITLYFLQSEFDAYNAAAGSGLQLPAHPGDLAGIGNLVVVKYSGVSGDGTGLPGSYTSHEVVIDPVDSNVVWNPAVRRWEVSFDVVGFSGFFLHARAAVSLPVTWVNFTVQRTSDNKAWLQWQTAGEMKDSHFEIEHSKGGRVYTMTGMVVGSGDAGSGGGFKYAFVDESATMGANFYRIRQVAADGRSATSEMREVDLSKGGEVFVIMEDTRVGGKLSVWFNRIGHVIVYTVDGTVVGRREVGMGYQLIDVGQLPAGMYLLRSGREVRRFIIE